MRVTWSGKEQAVPSYLADVLVIAEVAIVLGSDSGPRTEIGRLRASQEVGFSSPEGGDPEPGHIPGLGRNACREDPGR